MKTAVLVAGIVFGISAAAWSEEPVYPVRVSSNGRYFVDQKRNPVFWLGTTQWQLFREYKLEEARLIIEKSKDKGFAFIQVMLMGVGDGTRPNVYGEKPWINDDPLTPNEAYFKNVAAVLQVDTQRLSFPAKAQALWIDPRTGSSVSAGTVGNQSEQSFETPEGWEDALLVLERER